MLFTMLRLPRARSRARWTRTPQDTPLVWRSVLSTDAAIVRFVGNLQVSGTVPDARPLLLAVNHIGVFDPLVVIAACRRLRVAPRFMLAGGLLDAPVVGRLLRASGHLRVDRHDSGSALAQFAAATATLRTSQAPLVVYPEGRISRDRGLWPERGKTGVARMALAARAEVVPVSQWGAHEAVYWGSETVRGPRDVLPLARSGLSAPLRRPTLQVHFGEPVRLDDIDTTRAGAAMHAHRRIMQAITDGLLPLRADEPDVPQFTDPTRPTDGTSPWRPTSD